MANPSDSVPGLVGEDIAFKRDDDESTISSSDVSLNGVGTSSVTLTPLKSSVHSRADASRAESGGEAATAYPLPIQFVNLQHY